MSKRFSGLLSLLLAALCLFTACSGDPGQPGSDTATSAALPSRPGTASSTSQNGSSSRRQLLRRRFLLSA